MSSPWGAVAPADAGTAAGLAARLGSYCWAEQQLFALLGGWVADIGEPDVELAMAEHADHAGWRAERWYEALPAAAPGRDALVQGPDAVASALDEVRTAGSLGTATRLAVAHRVLLPRMAAALRAHLDWSSPVAEAPVARLLRLCLGDVTTDWVHGERLLQALGGPGAAGPEADRLESALAAAGGLLGPGSVGDRVGGGGA